jgi:hypothetical protein
MAAETKMAPDGYTWLLGAVHHSIAPNMYLNPLYDITKEWEQAFQKSRIRWSEVVKKSNAKLD